MLPPTWCRLASFIVFFIIRGFNNGVESLAELKLLVLQLALEIPFILRLVVILVAVTLAVGANALAFGCSVGDPFLVVEAPMVSLVFDRLSGTVARLRCSEFPFWLWFPLATFLTTFLLAILLAVFALLTSLFGSIASFEGLKLSGERDDLLAVGRRLVPLASTNTVGVVA